MTTMPLAARFTLDDLDQLSDADRYELLDGQFVEKRMGAKSDEIALCIGSALRDFVMKNKLGRVYGSQTGYKNCFPSKPNSLRRPDVTFVALARLPSGGQSPSGDFAIAPDLAVEVISPNDLYEEMEVKLTDYKQAGIRLVWVVSPTCKTVQVRRLDGSLALLQETESLSGEDVIPGFTCLIAELFI